MSVFILLPLVALHFTWAAYPSLVWCVLFWCTWCAWHSALLYDRRDRPVSQVTGYIAMAFGAAMNALVTIANSGRMPVAGKVGPDDSIWIALQPTHQLTALADILWGGLSLGDVFLTIGLVLVFATSALTYSKKADTKPVGTYLSLVSVERAK